MSESKNGLPTKVVPLPQVFLPDREISDNEAAVNLFKVLAEKLCIFTRAGKPVVIVKDDSGGASIQPLTNAAAVGVFTKHVRFMVHGVGANGEPVEKGGRCTEQQAKLFLSNLDASALLPKLDGVRSLPILRFGGNGNLVITKAGYDAPSRLYIVNGLKDGADPSLPNALKIWSSLLEDFRFQNEGARSRASMWLLSLLTSGGLGAEVFGPMPLLFVEADASQTGKGYLTKIAAAVMGEKMTTVTNQGMGSVGNMSESIVSALFKGNPLILMDNLRGKVDCQTLESAMTTPEGFSGRIPHVGQVTINTEKFCFLATSNEVQTTTDLANRSCYVQLLHQPDGYEFKRFNVGIGGTCGLLEFIKRDPSHFLRAGFVILREAHRREWKKTRETRHNFNDGKWAQTFDYIGQHIFGLAPLMDDHEAAQARSSNPAQSWARVLMLEVVRGGNLGQEMRALPIGELCQDAGIDIPGLKDNGDSEARAKAVGVQMGKLFTRDDGKTVFDVEGGTITRRRVYEDRRDGLGSKPSWVYIFERAEVVAPVVTAPKVADVVTVPTRSIVPAPSVAPVSIAQRAITPSVPAPVVSRFGDDVAAAMSKDSPLARVPDVSSVAPDPVDKLRITDQAIQAGAGDWNNPTSEARMLELKGFMPSGRESVGTVARLLRLMRDRTPAEVRLTIDEGLRRGWWCSSLVPDPRNLKAEAKEFLSFPPQTIKPREAHHEHQEAEGLPF